MPVTAAAKYPDAYLHPDLIIGFAGHRFLENEHVIHAAITTHLEQLKKTKTPRAISSIAIGADMLFAQAALELRIPWHVYLPFPENEFRDDFSRQDWLRAKALITRAASVNPPPPPPANAARDTAYSACADRIVAACDLLLAVWDGKPARGPGGTQETIARATTLGKRVIIIDSATGAPGEPTPTPP